MFQSRLYPGYSPEAYCKLSHRYDLLKRILRLFAVALGVVMMRNMLNPGIWILSNPDATITKVGGLSSSGYVFGWAWILLAISVMPYLLCHIIGVTDKVTLRPCTRLACLALSAGASLWGYLAWLARDLDYPAIVTLFGSNAFIDLMVSAALAISINENQKLVAGEAA